MKKPERNDTLGFVREPITEIVLRERGLLQKTLKIVVSTEAEEGSTVAVME